MDTLSLIIVAGLLGLYLTLAELVRTEIKHAPPDPHDRRSLWCSEGDALTRCTKFVSSKERV